MNSLYVISDNCASYFMHKLYNLDYNTPFVDILIDNLNYIRLLKELNRINLYNTELVDKEMYENNGGHIPNDPEEIWSDFPLVCIDKKVVIFPIHYKSYTEFLSKWNKRLIRLNWQNLLYFYTDYINNPKKEESLTKFLEYTKEGGRRIVFTDRTDLVNDEDTLFYHMPQYEFDYKNYERAFSDPVVKSFIFK